MNDFLLRVGVVEVTSNDWGDDFAATYGDSLGESITVVFQRGGREITSETTVRTRTTYEHRLSPAQDATERQLAVWRGIIGGTR